MPTPKEFLESSYLYGGNAGFIEHLLNKYIDNPDSVDKSWAVYFEALGDNPEDIKKHLELTSLGAVESIVSDEEATVGDPGHLPTGASPLLIKTFDLINAYRSFGHSAANLDPLGIYKPPAHIELDPGYHGFDLNEHEASVDLGAKFPVSGKVSEILKTLQAIYSTNIGYEYTHIDNPEERLFLQGKIEAALGQYSVDPEVQKRRLDDIIEAEGFEKFLHTRFPGAKRFSIEGGESMIAAIEEIIDLSLASDVEEIILGMAHRGRLNTLTKICGKSYHSMLSEFQGNAAHPEHLGIPGDVKYHLGWSTDRTAGDRNVHVSLAPNPSHLEAINPVISGKVRAKQDLRGDSDRTKVFGIYIHGDAAMAGQGVVYETLASTNISGYRTGGSINIVINNQIGFTATSEETRFTRYCTDVGKAFEIPVFHVNGDDIDAVLFVARLAFEYKQKFHKDVIIDINCYRRYGHNEGDEPFFTQPVMYKKIADHKTTANVYADKLIADGVVTKEEFDAHSSDFKQKLEEELKIAETFKPEDGDWLKGSIWQDFTYARSEDATMFLTGVEESVLKSVGEKLVNIPAEINMNKKIARQLDTRKKIIDSGEGIDWSLAGMLAYGSLLLEGYAVRISGQDSERGTFSQRHSAIIDQDNEKKYVPLANLSADQGKFEVINSLLSEYGVMGFEYGYSTANPFTLIIWEGQFGDFANGAQIMIDQFIASGEAKWLRTSGLILYLPHGNEGQGPEHSSARLERFLQLCADQNMRVANCTTPANYFHIIRRQIYSNFRVPLILMTPKSLLRSKLAVSGLAEMSGETFFQEILLDHLEHDPASIRKVILCSGKVYYDLIGEREKRGVNDVVMLRIEQLYPFPYDLIKAELEKYPNAQIVWCQEEQKNAGAWFYTAPRIEDILVEIRGKLERLPYVGRKESASPAVGYADIHKKELEEFLNDAFN